MGSLAAVGGRDIKDVDILTMYTFEDCMDACEKYNDDLVTGRRCWAVTYNSNLTSVVESQGGNCFLKDGKGINSQGSAEVASAAIAL